MPENRSYLKSHPWLTFGLDLQQFPSPLWIALGEAASKCEHLAGTPLQPSVANELMRVYLAKGVTATTAIEGNSLTEAEVRLRIEGRLELPPSKEYLGQEVDNVVTACNSIGHSLLGATGEKLTVRRILEFNGMVLKGLAAKEGVVPGEIRGIGVGVGRYRGAPAEDCGFLLERLVATLLEFDALPYGPIVRGLLKAIFAHLYITWIHPFGDGNGRTARLVEFQLLLEAGVTAPAAHLLSNHYNQTRSEYTRQLDRTSRSGGDIVPFIQYAVEGFVDGLREHIARIRSQQLAVFWVNFVHEQFVDREAKVDKRRKLLLLEISQFEDVPLSEVRHLTAKIAEGYAGKSDRLILRDLQELMAEHLVVEARPKVFRANKELILAFLPRKKPGETGGTIRPK